MENIYEGDMLGGTIGCLHDDHLMLPPVPPPPVTIAILVIATGSYVRFIPELSKGIKEWFCPQDLVSLFVLTDAEEIPGCDENTHLIHAEHKGWPEIMLSRYATLLQCFAPLDKDTPSPLLSYAYVYHMDADMRIVSLVPREELLGNSVACISPVGHNWAIDAKPFSRLENSKAYVAPGEGTEYYTGSLFGGCPEAVVRLLTECQANIDEDSQVGIINEATPEESHLNRWFISNPPTTVLTPEYCYPDGIYSKFFGSKWQRKIIMTYINKPESKGR